ncbi:MAG TPA: MotA/TolQ/ExbB proton channel family protein [Spirochaetota bacterium]|nr:MotA/TolQ/ExbB proton channel family protein [Spirochaetota bacterium]HQP47658.1 MotA/TolQ/ExbB proton channel family protein [Spirochaetota bacterium]
MKKVSFCLLLFFALSLCAIAQQQRTPGNGTQVQNAAPTAQEQQEAGTTQPAEQPTQSAPREDSSETIMLFDLFTKGGPFMWPIFIIAGIGCGFVIERFIYFKRANLNPREFIATLEDTITNRNLDDVEKLCREHNLVLSKIILKGHRVQNLGYDHVEKAIAIAASIEVAVLEKGLNIISAIGNISPLLGFLGTVSGMITAFSNIAAADQVNARLVAGGIEEALITTAAGLIVAIPMLIFYNYFVHRIDVFVADVERISADILEKMVDSNA